MRKLLLLAFGCLIALPSLSQVDPDFTDFSEAWKFAKGKLTPLTLEAKGYVRIVLEPADSSSTWIYTITRTKKVIAYDSALVDYNNDNAAIVYSAGWAKGTGLTKFFNSDYQFGSPNNATRTAVFSWTSAKMTSATFWSERFNVTGQTPHGKYTVTVDNGTPFEIDAGIPPINSDKDRGQPSYRTVKLAPGTHKITISTSAQMVVDKFTLVTYTPK